ncbi:hypothetical protein HOC80_03870 [archaeon]|jgi:hypothetical protein|nr:hypothetical protein [archaeon]MBT4417214.1 hypothetical protein [archaeon]
MIYFSWECPPRVLKNGKLDFDVDLAKIFNGERLDEFTELPKFIEFKEIEEKFVGKNYVKIIADTNASILAKQNFSFKKYKEELQRRCKSKVVLFSEIVDMNQYKKKFELVYRDFWDHVSLKEFLEIKSYLKEHVGLDDDDFVRRVIVSYIVEGFLIPYDVWVNFDEPKVLAEMTNRIEKRIKILYF